MSSEKSTCRNVGLGLGLLFLSLSTLVNAETNAPEISPIVLLTVEGIIDPVTARYLDRQMTRAEQEQAALVIVDLDTPGGLDQSMRVITKRLINSSVPSVVYVAPAGSRAASAGAFIGMAADWLVMAPGTTVGAAHPVDQQGHMSSEKITNDATAYMASLARLHQRPEPPAMAMVRNSTAYPAEAAIRLRLADFSAESISDLLRQLEGRNVVRPGRSTRMALTNHPLAPRPSTWVERFLHALTNPNLAYVLFLVGIYGMIYELASPGAIFPGVVGAISLLLALMGFNGLPVSMTGVLMLVLAASLLVLELFIVSHGILAVGGVVALVLGSLMLLPSDLPMFRIANSVLWTMSGISTVLVTALVLIVLRARRPGPAVSGMERLINARGQVVSVGPGVLIVRLQGEEWSALSEQSLTVGQTVTVVGLEGLRLRVHVEPNHPQTSE